MEHLEFEFSGSPHAQVNEGFSLVGVVGSGNLEVMIEPENIEGRCRAIVNTSVRGHEKTWKAVLTDFFERQALANVVITINDGGATPAVVSLRLDQATATFIDTERLS